MLSDCSTLLSILLILLSIFIYKVLRKKRFSAKVGWGGGGTGEAIPHFKELFPAGHRHCGAWHRRAQEHLRRMPPQFGDQGGGCVCARWGGPIDQERQNSTLALTGLASWSIRIRRTNPPDHKIEVTLFFQVSSLPPSPQPKDSLSEWERQLGQQVTADDLSVSLSHHSPPTPCIIENTTHHCSVLLTI